MEVGDPTAAPVEPLQPTPVQPASDGVPWRWWDALVIFALAQVAVTVIAGIAAGVFGEDALFATLVVATGAVTAGVTLVWVNLRAAGRLRLLLGPRRPTWRDVGAGVGLGVGAFLGANVGLSLLLQWLVERLGGELPPVQAELQAALTDPAVAPLLVFSVAVLAPLGEELLFRGVLYQGLRRTMPVWSAVPLSALGFAVTHIEWLAVVVIFPVGILFAWAFERRGTLVVPIAAHATFNLINVVLLQVGIA